MPPLEVLSQEMRDFEIIDPLRVLEFSKLFLID